MRKYLIFISIVLVCLTLTSCDIFAWKKYYNREYKISMLLPRDWEIDEEAQDAILVVSIPQDNPQAKFKDNMRMIVQDLPAQIDLSTYFDLNREEILAVFPKHGNILEGQGMSRFVRYQWLAFDAEIAKGVQVRATNTVWFKDKRVYILTYVVNLNNSPKLEPQFRKIISSIRL